MSDDLKAEYRRRLANMALTARGAANETLHQSGMTTDAAKAFGRADAYLIALDVFDQVFGGVA